MSGHTYVGIQLFRGIGSLLLVNDATGSTRTWVAYFEDEPVLILEVEL